MILIFENAAFIGKNKMTDKEEGMQIVFWQDREKKIANVDLFDSQAFNFAKELSEKESRKEKKIKNHSSQLRNFYDETIRFKMKIIGDKDSFPRLLPYIKMLNPKFAYSHAKGHITTKCRDNFKNLIEQIKTYDDFLLFASFFEAVMAFYKEYSEDKGE